MPLRTGRSHCSIPYSVSAELKPRRAARARSRFSVSRKVIGIGALSASIECYMYYENPNIR